MGSGHHLCAHLHCTAAAIRIAVLQRTVVIRPIHNPIKVDKMTTPDEEITGYGGQAGTGTPQKAASSGQSSSSSSGNGAAPMSGSGVSQGATRLVIGGKSMGGRVASMIYEDLVDVVGLVCLGYPFHPPGKPDRLRVEHLRRIKKPVLVIQGERDALGNRQEVDRYQLPRHFQVEWLEDGDHSFKPRKASGFTQQRHLEQAIEVMAGWCKSIS